MYERLPDFYLEDFDKGFVTWVLGAQEKEDGFYCEIEGLKKVAGRKPVKVYFVVVSHAEIFPRFELPAIVVKRRWEIDRARLLSWSKAYSIEVDDKIEERFMPVPVNIFYTVNLMARYQGDMLTIWRHFIKRWQYPFTILKFDVSEEKYLTFECFIDSISDISEIVDVAEKIMAFAAEFKVLGCLPLAKPVQYKKVIEREVRLEPIKK